MRFEEAYQGWEAGALDQRVRRAAAALRAQGLRREARVLVLMQVCNDWPVAFFGRGGGRPGAGGREAASDR